MTNYSVFVRAVAMQSQSKSKSPSERIAGSFSDPLIIQILAPDTLNIPEIAGASSELIIKWEFDMAALIIVY